MELHLHGHPWLVYNLNLGVAAAMLMRIDELVFWKRGVKADEVMNILCQSAGN